MNIMNIITTIVIIILLLLILILLIIFVVCTANWVSKTDARVRVKFCSARRKTPLSAVETLGLLVVGPCAKNDRLQEERF